MKPNLFWKILLWFWLSFVLIFILNLFILQLNNDNISYQKTPDHLSRQVVTLKDRISRYLVKESNQKKSQHSNWDNVYLLSPDGVDRLGKPVPAILFSFNQYMQINQQQTSVVTKNSII